MNQKVERNLKRGQRFNSQISTALPTELFERVVMIAKQEYRTIADVVRHIAQLHCNLIEKQSQLDNSC